MVESPRTLEFLRKCHEAMSENSDNSLRIPLEISNKYEHSVDMKKERQRYLVRKFQYLLLLEDNSIYDDEHFKALLNKAGDSDLVEFMGDWKENSEKERIAYFYRYSQLPLITVHDWWYCQDIRECVDWCRRRQHDMKELELESLKRPWEVKIEEIYRNVGERPSLGIREDWMLSSVFVRALQAFTHRINGLHTSLSKGSKNLDTLTKRLSKECQELFRHLEGNIDSLCRTCGTSLQVPEESPCTQKEDGFLTGLSIELVQQLFEVGFDEDLLIRAFLLRLKEEFKCEVCDYLDVSEDGRSISWRLATTEYTDLSHAFQKLTPEEQRLSVKERESYRAGEGISGTVLLVSNTGRHNWFHTGSNDVLEDPRQSEKHRTAYEKDMYPGVLKALDDKGNNGKIRNFWMFPIFRKGVLIGAFRVVNKLLNDERLMPGGWPYDTRVKLSLIADWFSSFLEAVEPELEKKEDFATFFSWGSQIDEMVMTLRLEWVNRRFLQAIMRQLAKSISKKEEKRSVGCTILIEKRRPGELIARTLEYHPVLKLTAGSIKYPYDGLDKYLDIVDPMIGVFVFDEKGEFIRVAKLSQQSVGTQLSPIGIIESFTEQSKHSVCFLLSRFAKNILVYQNGNLTAELYLSERSGEWRFRYRERLLSTIQESASVADASFLPIILKTALELSRRRLGGILVVGSYPNDAFQFGETEIPFEAQHINKVEVPVLVELAKKDGATFIDSNGILTRFNSTVTPLKPTPEPKLFLDRGARHRIGEVISNLAPEALVIIVSEDGGISIVKNGECLVRTL